MGHVLVMVGGLTKRIEQKIRNFESSRQIWICEFWRKRRGIVRTEVGLSERR